MSKLVNLNKARKDRKRDAQKRDAEVNAARFGRSKAEKQAMAAKLSKAVREPLLSEAYWSGRRFGTSGGRASAAASGCEVATMPLVARTGDRPGR